MDRDRAVHDVGRAGFPPLCLRSRASAHMHELNVRTYVHLDGVPGVWFFSLDTNSTAAVLGARTFFHLPYYTADIELDENKRRIKYDLERTEEPEAKFKATWRVGDALPQSQPGSREFFLTERYILYTEYLDKLYRARIYHEPWQLYEAELSRFSSTMLEANQLVQPKTEPLLHYAEEISVDIWFLERV